MHRDPFGRVLAAPKPEPEIMNFKNPFHTRDSVGTEGRNSRRDVAKMESLLGRTGDLNLDETDGVTGFVGLRMDEAIRRFQKRNRLRVDGQINPGGETLTTLGATLAAEPQSDADTNDGSDRQPERKPPLIPERPPETRDRMDKIPTVPGTLDKNEIFIKNLKDILRIIRERSRKRA